ncbi:sigma-54-dependent Fis family transcriptional regulator [Marinomonas hwangdonensis]|uniref:Sigma-54-dependent Fis family transcriptional regulator n=1 Tax=Marinomonas hwangdonensis TaxID=1053647 RepID=A0A3M8Q3D2_9GAMM|nr:sigma-54 dependent transcriptional regulator [Marinomonas hwangdonensis]RNF50605.1 sigma-54-dependent Fis family transcriptional regulator [Marinomonas hwangdonensis]
MQQTLYPQFKILLVDDEPSFVRSMSLTLERYGINNLTSCTDPTQVQQKMAHENIALVLLDLTMPVLSGQALLGWLKEEYPHVSVIIFSGINQVDAAVDCVKRGAFDYIVKTTDQEHILESIKRAIHTQELSLENQALRAKLLSQDLNKADRFSDFITADPKMMSTFRYLESISTSSQAVLITGESGVGKELIAHAIHELSERKGPLVTVNVAGLDDNIFSDTLFGHAKGAFTGADKMRPGLVESAAGGTLFLDEIGDLSANSQVKLLRLLQEGEYYPIGSDQPKRINARVIVATHHDLMSQQQQGTFRKDLYYRLCTHMVTIPPLRERLNDLPLLIDFFVHQACNELNKPLLQVPQRLATQLQFHHFPGNVRELRALIYDAVSQSQHNELSLQPFTLLINNQEDRAFTSSIHFDENIPLPTLSQLNAILVETAMLRANNNQSLAARMLGISQPALSKRLKNMKTQNE